MSKDLLVNLYSLEEYVTPSPFKVVRILSPDIFKLESFIAKHFNQGWVSEIRAGCYKSNPTVFIACDETGIIGFAGYDCTAKGMFGPTGVDPHYRGRGIGRALLLTTLLAMREDGYAYAIIGGGEEKARFYQKCVGATLIEQKASIYQRLIK